MSTSIGLICQRDVVTIRESEDLTAAAQRMREEHIGYLIVVEADQLDRSLRPVGVLTDRDIVIAVVAKGVDPHTLTVGDVMTRQPVVVTQDSSVRATLQEMRRIGVRRVPIVGARGDLVGMVSIDDILETLAEELGNIAGSIRKEQRTESAFRT
jgi:CBS domain-containing protein